MEPGGWEELSQSSRRALQFAWAAAQCRTGSEPIGAVVNDWDLLVGILLAHPGTSEAEQTFRHFRLVAGQAFSSEYPRLDSPQLNRALAELPPTGFPETDEFVDNIVRDALSLRSPRSEVSELRSLWVALLQGRGPASEAVRDLLARRGVNPVDLASLSREWLGSGDDRTYDAVLASLPAAPVDVVNYKTDQARRSETHAYDDLIGISAEVDAFAYLLASRSLDPPLAVGLFGAWGSGKSYFLDAIRRRIDQLVAAEAVHAQPQKAVPFWKRIVQVEFNAWHYVEGDLWSSLVDHNLNQLNLASEKLTDNVVEDRQRYLLAQLETTSAGIRDLVKRQETIEGDLRESESRLDELEKQRNDALKAFEAVEARRVAEQGVTSSRTSVLKALRAVKLDRGEGDMTLGTALDTLASARSELERGRALVRPFAMQPTWLIALVVALLIVPPLVGLALQRLLGSTTEGWLGGVGSLLATLTAAVGLASRWVQSGLDQIEQARREVSREFDQADAARQKAIEEARQDVALKTQALEQAQSEKQQKQADLEQIKGELEKRPPELLYEFLRNRLEAGEYRKRLGVPAIIRRDFKSLAELIFYQNAFLLADPAEKDRLVAETEANLLPEDDPRIINRIVLYIDDLDRCPDGKVVEVLQAVHLLLAFPLFVVVVAVDSRWLANALQSRYPALVSDAEDGAVAQPDDYLEKIFQIPFWVAELDDAGRGRIVRGLLGGHVRAEGNATPREAAIGVNVGPDEERVLTEMIDARSGPPLVDIATLTVSRGELGFLDSLTPLMGGTPRSVKRFVNVYQLIKILRSGRPPTGDGFPSDEQLAAFLLAVAEGLPGVSWLLTREAKQADGRQLLTGLMSDPLVRDGPPDELRRLDAWLREHPEWGAVPAERIAALAADVDRFLFRLARRGAPSPSVPRPQLVHLIQDR